MSLLLNIDTSGETAFVCLSENGIPLATEISSHQKEHASFLHPAIDKIMIEKSRTMNDIDGISVVIGPGSYTGLRVGLASAKGLCYVLNKPLICISALEILAFDMIFHKQVEKGDLVCPLIDARRMEVFTSLYDDSLQIIGIPEAKILDEASYSDLLSLQRIVFCGSGAPKFKQINSSPNAQFTDTIDLPQAMSHLSHQYFEKSLFSDLSMTEPLYIKDYKAY